MAATTVSTARSVSLATSVSRLPSAARRGDGAAGDGQLRLTRRGRVAVLLLTLIVLLGAGVMVRESAGASTAPPAPASAASPETRVVVVQAGETLWQVARQIDPQADPREVIHEIRQLNELPGGYVRAGQELVVPA